MAHFILADLQELTRYAFASLIYQQEDNTISMAYDKVRIIELLKQDGHSIVILDYTIFDFNDVEQLLIVCERFPLSMWIIASEDLTIPFMHQLIYVGHNISIVFKDSPLNTVKEALDDSLHGNRYICQRAMEMLLEQQQKEEAPGVLTATEVEILKAIAQGRTTKEIASERFSSIHTVNTHRKNIFRKLGVNTAHEAVKYAFRAGLVDPSEFYI